MKRYVHILVPVAVAAALLVPTSAHAATLTVNSVGDESDVKPGNGVCKTAAGTCTLRAAMEESNATPSVTDVIRFNLPGSGVRTIAPAAALPDLTDNVSLDAYTQPGSKAATSSAPAVILVQLDGALAGSGAAGLVVKGGNTTVKGLSIVNFGRFGISLVGPAGANKVHGNYIGLAPDGITPGPNTWEGVSVFESKQNQIGGSEVAQRNVISGNGLVSARDGIEITGVGSTANIVRGNYIGTDHTGTTAVPNIDDGVTVDDGRNNKIIKNVISGNRDDGVLIHGDTATGNTIKGNLVGTERTGTSALANGGEGVQIWGSSSNTVGGTSSADANVISGNLANGVRLRDSASGLPAKDNKIVGNMIGTSKARTGSIPNARNGIWLLNSPNTTIGGTTLSAANDIAGNLRDGIQIEGAGSTGNKIRGNYVGLTRTGVALPNADDGVVIDGASSNVVGGTVSGARNVIANNAGDGVLVRSGTGNSVQRNHVYANGGLGLDLEPFGVTVNDVLDVDLGANDLQNFPELTTAQFAGGVLTVDGVLNSAGATTYAIELFASTACDASNHGEAERYIGSFSVTTAGDGTAAFVTPLSVSVPAGQFVTATATDPAGNTSELSACSLVS